MGCVSCPAGPLRDDPAPAGVTPPAGAHRAPEGLTELRHLLRPEVDPAVLAHLAALRASEPEWPPRVLRAGPTVRAAYFGIGAGGERLRNRCGASRRSGTNGTLTLPR